MIKGHGVMHLDGDFKKDFPEPIVRSSRDESGKWSVTKAGPRYVNVYEVTEYDEEGEQYLRKVERQP